MADQLPVPPLPFHPQPGAARLTDPRALFFIAVGLGVAAALVTGGATGAVVVAAGRTNCAPNDGWCELGAAALGALAALVLGVVAYVVAGVTTIVRCRPAGHRTGHVLAHLAAPFGMAAIGLILSMLTP